MGGRLPVVQVWPSNDDPRVPTLPRAMPHTGRLTTQVRWFQEDAINFALANEAKGKGSILALDMVSLAPTPPHRDVVCLQLFDVCACGILFPSSQGLGKTLCALTSTVPRETNTHHTTHLTHLPLPQSLAATQGRPC